jgi:hypothetical protein
MQSHSRAGLARSGGAITRLKGTVAQSVGNEPGARPVPSKGSRAPEVIDVDTLVNLTASTPVGIVVKPERRRSVGDRLYKMVVEEGQSFWTSVYPLYMQRDITREQIRDLVRRALIEARGNYKIVARLFNLEPRDYKRFLNFLRKHECQLPFEEFR